jgi:hypothetical protein
MTQIFGWLSNTALLSILGSALAFMWSTYQQIAQRKAEAREREFHNFHKLVKQLVSPDSESETTFIDRQGAVAFELRHFPRYYELTERMLLGLKKGWAEIPNPALPRLIKEIDLTLQHIQQNR